MVLIASPKAYIFPQAEKSENYLYLIHPDHGKGIHLQPEAPVHQAVSMDRCTIYGYWYLALLQTIPAKAVAHPRPLDVTTRHSITQSSVLKHRPNLGGAAAAAAHACMCCVHACMHA